jgi:hypothetical protein
MFGIEASTWIESNAGLRALRDDEGGGARPSGTKASGGEGA